MNVFEPNILWPVLGAMFAGGAIGLEREFRARAAGFRTHMLVALSTSLLMVFAMHQREWFAASFDTAVVRIDPVRMAQGIVTGIGFLCGGVIFRAGLSVHGLTTAASLWVAAVIGILFGVGLYELAVLGTVLVLMVLTVFRLVDAYLPSRAVAEVKVRFRRNEAPDEAAFAQMLSGLMGRNARVATHLTGDGQFVEYRASIRTLSESGAKLGRQLLSDARVVDFSIEPRDG